MEKIKKYLFFLLLPTLFFIKINVYAEEKNYCSFLIQNINQNSTPYTTRFYSINNNNNFCTGSSNYIYTAYNLSSRTALFSVFGVDFKVDYTLNSNSSYSQDLWNKYILLYNSTSNLYQYRLSSSDNFRAYNTNNVANLTFSENSEDFSGTDSFYKATFTNNIKNIYVLFYYRKGLESEYCYLDTNSSNPNFNGNDIPSCENSPVPEDPTPTPPEESIEINLDKIYVPNYQKGQCVEIIDKDTIRVFENENTEVFTDYYINSHYISKKGQIEQEYVKSCSDLEFTSIRYYGNDFPEILFMFLSLSVVSTLFIYILFKVFRKRR